MTRCSRSRGSLLTRRAVFVPLAVAALARPGRAAAPPLRLQGSTTFNSELMAEHKGAIEAAAGVRLGVVPNKSSLGLIALCDDEADLAMISTRLANEMEVVRQARPSLPTGRLQEFEVARTRAALIVHPGNPLTSVSAAGLRRILLGTAVNWREFGGPDLPIRIVAVRAGGGVVATVEAAMLGAGHHVAAPDQVRVQNGPQVVRVVEQEPGALGITQVKLTVGRGVRELGTPAALEQVLLLVSLGDPTPPMLAVINGCRTVASAAGMR